MFWGYNMNGKFRTFLDEKGLYDKYMEYFDKGEAFQAKNNFSWNDTRTYIVSAFDWKDTDDPVVWDKADNEWCELVDNWDTGEMNLFQKGIFKLVKKLG